jgi:glycosyltransferase involved in cell wall biosynthesis
MLSDVDHRSHMKILVATFTYYPNVDGVAEAARSMVGAFLAEGHEVSVVTSEFYSVSREMAPNAAAIYRFSISGTPAVGNGFRGEVAEYRDFLTKHCADVIIFHGWDTWPVAVALPILPKLRGKSVLVSHGYAGHVVLDLRKFPRGLRSWFRWLPHVFSLPWHIRAFDQVVFLCHKADFTRFFDVWVAKKTKCRNTIMIPNGIDSRNWHLIPTNFREYANLSDGVFFLYVANYFPGKNQAMALEAFCNANIQGSALVFIGSELGDYGSSVMTTWNNIRANYPNLSVHFYENLERSEVISAFRSCDIAVISSKSEAQPLTILESMACGKPFISTNVGCVSEFEGGIIVKNIEEMARAMRELAENPAERGELGRRGKECFDLNYSAEVTTRAWLDLINQLVGKGNAV